MSKETHVADNADGFTFKGRMTIWQYKRQNNKKRYKTRRKAPVPPHEICWSIPWTVGRGDQISTKLLTAHKMGKTNTGVALAVRRWRWRCYSVGSTVESGSERWFCGAASVDRAALCAFGRWLGGFFSLAAYRFWLRSWTDRFDRSSDRFWIAWCNLRRFWFCCWTSAPIIASLSASMVEQFYCYFKQNRCK